MNLEEVLNFRRSVRRYDKNKPIDPEKVKHCLELATLAPNSSNMQLWEFYQITNPGLNQEAKKWGYFEKKIKSPFTCLKWETILGGCF